MYIATILEQVQKEIKVYQCTRPTKGALSADCSGAGEPSRRDEDSKQLAELWTALHDAAEQMQAAKSKIVKANLLLVASNAKSCHFPKSSLSFLDLM